MSNYRTVSFRIAEEKVAELDQIAKSMDRDRSYLLNEAVGGYLEEQKQWIAQVQKGIEAAERGEWIEDEELGRRIDSWMESAAQASAQPKRRKTA